MQEGLPALPSELEQLKADYLVSLTHESRKLLASS